MTNEKLFHEKMVKDLLSGKTEQMTSDKKFKFTCERCGSCCWDRGDIIIHPYDLYRMSAGMGMSSGEIMNKYGKIHIGTSSFLPVATIKFNTTYVTEKGMETKKCPFLKRKDDYLICTIHHCKPMVCALSPLGRIIDSIEYNVLYYIPEGQCNFIKNPCENIIKKFVPDIENSEKCFKLQMKFFTDLDLKFDMKAFFDNRNDNFIMFLYNIISSRLYYSADTKKSVVDNVKYNFDLVVDLLTIGAYAVGHRIKIEKKKSKKEDIANIITKITIESHKEHELKTLLNMFWKIEKMEEME